MNIILKMADEIDGLHEILERLKRENEEKDRQIAFLKDSHDAIRELAYKTGVEEEREERDRLKRENAILREELQWYMTLDIQRTWTEMSDEEADAQAEKEITWLVLHNEGAE
jgi:hypothetical protein